MLHDSAKRVWTAPTLERVSIVDTAAKPNTSSENQNNMNPSGMFGS